MANSRLANAIKFPLYFVLLIWAIHLFQVFTGMDLGQYGIYPRKVFGLRGIIFSPLLHGGFGHLINNSIPFFALGFIIWYFYPRIAFSSFVMMYFLTGVAVWLFGNLVFSDYVAFHIGASGVVYAMVSFVFWSGVFRKNVKSIVLALIVAVYYSGMFLGILPNQEGISWESHLLGGLVGIFVAYWFKDKIETDEVPKRYSWEEEPESEGSFFLPRDAFDKTREQRQRERDQQDGDWFSSGTF
jgi:membrane associated rhomboid family serine protease